MSQVIPITTHVLDLAKGRPAVDVEVFLHRLDEGGRWIRLAGARTDEDGRVGKLQTDASLAIGVYRFTFETGQYLGRQNAPSFFPRVKIEFIVDKADRHYHVPLLLSPYGYSTYRGT